MNNKGYKDDFIERLKFNNDIVSTVSKYVTLQQKGKSHWGCCPFHNEKTPSFTVNPVEQFYKCFGCGESGDVITFVQKMESIDFMEAVKILADAAGMEVPIFSGDKNIKEKKEKKDLFTKANKEAAIFYNKMLFTESGKIALDYLHKRGLDKNTITKFGLGYSPGWTNLVKHLKTKGYKEEDLKEAGLIDRGQKGNYYDIMAERLMFPIINSYGQVVGFSARALADGKFAKYRNTAQTLLFDKSRIVYGINLLKKLKQKSGLTEVILVEGQMDVIALHNAGFDNTVATMGTALTKNHAKEIKRFADKVIISYDGDLAGQKATMRSLDILQVENLNVYVVGMPEGLDPDDYIKKYGNEAYKKLINESLPLNDYKIASLAKGFDLSNNREVTKFIDVGLEEVKNLKNSAEREIYLNQIKDFSGVDIHSLRRDLEFKLRNVKQESENAEASKNKDANFKAGEFILASIIHKQPLVKLPMREAFENNSHLRLYDFIVKSQNSSKQVRVGDLFTAFNLEENKEIKSIIDYDFKNIENIQQYYKECAKNLELDNLLKKQKNIIELFNIETDKDKKNKLMQKLQKVTKDITNKKTEA
jgi:DNA primase